MTVSELRTLVDNLDEYIHIPGGIDRLKKMVLHLAVSGQLVPQDPSEGTGEELYREIQSETVSLVRSGQLKKQKILPEISDDEVPFKIPSEWRWTRVGDIARTIGGNAFKSSDFTDIGVRVVRISDFNENGFTSHRVVRVADASQFKMYKIQNGDILMCMTGGTVGKTYHVKFLPEEMLLNQRVAIIRSINDMQEFINIVVNSVYIKEFINSRRNSTNDNISMPDIQSMLIPLPSLAEQQRIIVKVESIFTLIDQLAEFYKSEQAERSKLVASLLAQLAKAENDVEDSLALTHLSEIIRTKADAKVLRQTILHLAVSGQLVPQDLSEGTGEELYQKIQSEKAELMKQGKLRKQKILPEISDDEMPFEVPHTWRWARLGSVGLTQTGGTPSKNNPEYFGSDVPFIKPGDITQTSVNYSNEGLSSLGASKLDRVAEAGSILMVCIGTIGKCQIIDRASSFNQQINSVTPYAQIHEYLYIAMQAQYFSALAWQKSSSTTIAILNKGKWESIPVPLPPHAEQKRIVAKTTQLLNLVTELEAHLEK